MDYVVGNASLSITFGGIQSLQSDVKLEPQSWTPLNKDSGAAYQSKDLGDQGPATYNSPSTKTEGLIEVSKATNHKKVAAGIAPNHGEKAVFPAEGGGTMSIFRIKASPRYYGAWKNTTVGDLRQASLSTENFEQAKATLFRMFGEARGGKKIHEVKFKTLADAYLATKLATHEDHGFLRRRLIPAFGDYPKSSMVGNAGTKTLAEWNAAQIEKARKANPEHDGAEVFFRLSRCVRSVLKHAGVKRDDLPVLPRRPKTRRAHLEPHRGEFAIIRAHLRARVNEVRPGTVPWQARMAIRLYFDFVTTFTGRTGTEALSVTFEGVNDRKINNKKWIAIEVDGKTGRDHRFASVHVLKIVDAIRKIHPTGKGHLFVNPDGEPRTVMHKLFRDAMLDLELKRGEPGRWSKRFVPQQQRAGGVSLYSVRHAKITGLERKGKPRASIAKAYGTGCDQIEWQYGHMSSEDALANL